MAEHKQACRGLDLPHFKDEHWSRVCQGLEVLFPAHVEACESHIRSAFVALWACLCLALGSLKVPMQGRADATEARSTRQ